VGKTEDRNANNPVETEGSAPPVESVIGRRIRALRNKKRLSLRKLSEASGLNPFRQHHAAACAGIERAPGCFL